MIIVGLTGGIGSGKSTVGAMFGELGIPVYNSDVEAKKLMARSKGIKKDIVSLLGEECYVDGKLNRMYIAKQVFKDSNLLQGLNNIVHPIVKKHFINWSRKQKTPYVIQEAAIIFENKTHEFYDKIILVTAPLEIRIKRVVDRDETSSDVVLERIKNQWTDSRKEKLSDYIIVNTNLEKTAMEVSQIHEKLLKIGA